MNKWRHTPGEIRRKVNPSSLKDRAYCTVNIFCAALVILYAGTGKTEYVVDFWIEPRVVDLLLVSI